MTKLAHVWSSDMGAAAALPHMRPFVDAGWQVFVICPDGPRLDGVRRAGFTWLPLSLARRLVDPVGDARAAAEIIGYCRRERFDVVHTHNIKAGLLGRVAASLGGTPRIVHTMHGMPFDRETPLPRRLGHIALEWMACRFVDRVLVQSRADEATMRAARVLSPRKLVRIGNGVPLDRFDPARADGRAIRAALALRPEDVLFVSAGRLVREKGFVELADAAGRARDRDPRVRVAIAGPLDEDKADCLSPDEMARARAAGVLFVGERTDMPDVLAAADAAVLPSWREGLPRFLMEAAAMGKPLLASDVRGCREVVDPPRGGALVPVRSAPAWADALVALAADPAARGAIGAYNRARALEEYDIRAVIRRLEAVYRELGA
ncbi:MAG TPA: glycosyltransferase family 4 protein [Haliangiales bacterium]|nr:glycosyltransferase family 4 protein [Haliangiales bacterium]